VRHFCVQKQAVFCVAILVLATSGVGSGQVRIGSRVVLATVTDTGNRPLVELGPDDFAVEEGGRERDILSLHMADYPMGILLDDTDAGAADADAIRSAAARFVAKIGERSVAIGTLTDPTHLLVPFDATRSEVLDRIRRFQPGRGTPRPLQAAATLAQAVRDTGSPFAAIVIVSARAISASEAPDREFLTPVLATGAPIYVVAKRAADAPAGAAESDVLHALAEQTRGQYTEIYSGASYSVALDRLADRLATEMMIEYVVPGAEPLTGDVRVGVKIPGARATGLGVSK
jgi:hypothetical protein